MSDLKNGIVLEINEVTADTKFLVNQEYRPIAAALCRKYQQINHILPEDILFIENLEGKGTSQGRKRFANISKIQAKWADVVHQITGCRFAYQMELYKQNIQHMSREQIVMLIYHELKHIAPNGDIIAHDIEDWNEIVAGVGPNWGTTKSAIPDLLGESVNWESIQAKGLFSPDNQG